MKPGIFSIYVALLASVYSGWFYYRAATLKTRKRKDNVDAVLNNLLKKGRRGFYIMAASVGVASFYLWYLIFSHQFQVSYVYRYTSRDLGIGYLFSAFWAGQEGSFLLWALLIAIMGLAFMRNARNLEGYAMLFLNIVQAAFLLLLIKASPFTLQQGFPSDGAGLNPLLQNPWMVIHPPILFLGYAATAIPFVIGLAALVKREYDNWVRIALPWTLFASITIGAGIIIGAYWAYKVLGWGGYWGWDPVENSSLIAWLTVLALFHGLLVTRIKKGLQKTNFTLAILSFVAVLYATFLTRSGVLSDFSVHSFEDLGISAYLTLYVLASLIFGFALLYVRKNDIPYTFIQFRSITKENILVISVLIFLASAFFTLVGTSSPLLTMMVGKPAQVDISFYNIVNLPIAILLSLALGVAPVLSWSEEKFSHIARKLIFSASIALISAIAVVFLGMKNALNILFVFSIMFALTTNLVVVISKIKNGWGLIVAPLAHVGAALLLLGIIISGVFEKTERTVLTQDIQKHTMGYQMTYKGAYHSPDGKDGVLIDVAHGNNNVQAVPRLYMNNYTRGEMREPYVEEGLLNDLYISPLQLIKKSITNNGNELTLKKGEQKQFAGYNILFSNFDLGNSETNGMFRVAASLQFEKGGTTFTVTPAMLLRGKERAYKPADIPSVDIDSKSKARVTLSAINAEQKNITLAFEGLGTSTNQQAITPSQVVIEISKKPFISFLWIGAILLTIGSFLAMQRRLSELKASTLKEK